MSAAPNIENKEQGISRIGFYDIERTIGKGNFAVVRLARHRITKSYVAVKIINKAKLDEVNLRKMYREIQIMQLINHPQIIKLFQVIETKTMLYLVTEYAENGELFDYVSKHGRMSEQNAKTVFAQIGSAVKYLHDNKIVHRDLKTENLLFDSQNRVKLADFGFANFFSDNGDLLSTWCGSPPYAAPEVFEGLRYHGPEIDIWSLGVILYVLVCGILPFSGDTLQSLRDHVLSCHFRVPFFLSTVCEDLIRRMLVRNPAKRLTISDVLRHPWLGGHICPEWQQPVPAITSDQRESILRLMQSLGISPARVMQSVESNAFDNYASMYHLLAERFVGRPRRTEGLIRRPSSLAEQAIEQATGSLNASPVPSSPVPILSNNDGIPSLPAVCSTVSTNSGAINEGFSVKAVSSSGLGSSLNDSPVAGVSVQVSSSSAQDQQQLIPTNFTPTDANTSAGAAALAMLYQQQQLQQNRANVGSHQQNSAPVSSNVPSQFNGVFRVPPFIPMPGPSQVAATGQSHGGHAQLAYRNHSNQTPQTQHHLEQPLFAVPALSLQQHHQYMSATSVPNSATTAAQSALAALHPFVFMNSHNLLPASYYGAFVLQQIQLQQQALERANSQQQSDMPMETTSPQTATPMRPSPLSYRPTSELPSNPLALIQQFELAQQQQAQQPQQGGEIPPNAVQLCTGRPPPGPSPLAAGSKRPPLLKRASLPADVPGHSVASAMNAGLDQRNTSGPNASVSSFSRPASGDYAQHAFVAKSSRRFHNVKLSPYPLPTQIELPSPADLQSTQQQRFVFMPSLSHTGAVSGGSTTQLQAATELLTIEESPNSAIASSQNVPNGQFNQNMVYATANAFSNSPSSSLFCAAANVRNSRSIDVELTMAARNFGQQPLAAASSAALSDINNLEQQQQPAVVQASHSVSNN